MLANRTIAATNPLLNRARLTNDPLRVRADGRTPQGKRIRDLFRAYQAAAGNAGDPATVASILAAAELTVASEAARAALLAGSGDIEQVIRLENLAARSVRRLGIKPTAAPKPPSLAEHLANRAERPVAAPPAPSAPPSPESAPAGEANVTAEANVTDASWPGGETRHGPPQDDGGALEERAATSGGDLP